MWVLVCLLPHEHNPVGNLCAGYLSFYTHSTFLLFCVILSLSLKQTLFEDLSPLQHSVSVRFPPGNTNWHHQVAPVTIKILSLKMNLPPVCNELFFCTTLACREKVAKMLCFLNVHLPTILHHSSAAGTFSTEMLLELCNLLMISQFFRNKK